MNVRKGDRYSVEGTLTDELRWPIDLSGAEGVRWWMRVNGGKEQEIDVTINRGTSQFVIPDLDTSEAGTVYEFEVEIDWGDGKIETIPNGAPLRVEIVAPLSNESVL